MMQKTVDRPSTESHEESDMLHKHSQWDCGRIFYFIFSFLLLHMKHIGEEKIFLGLVSCQLSNAQDDIIGRTEKIIKLRRAQSGRNIKICAKNFHCEWKQFFCECTRQRIANTCNEWLLTKKRKIQSVSRLCRFMVEICVKIAFQLKNRWKGAFNDFWSGTTRENVPVDL